MGFEKYAKNGLKNIYYYFLFFVIFSKCFKQKLIIPIESCQNLWVFLFFVIFSKCFKQKLKFLRWKKAKYS